MSLSTARICLRGDMQVNDGTKTWSPTASSRLLKCFMADAIANNSIIHQLDFIQAFIQSDTKKRIFVLLDQEYETFCPRLKEHFGRPLRLKKCLYGAYFSGKFWYETLNNFLVDSFGFKCSGAEGCLYIYRNGDDWIKMINYVNICSRDYNHTEIKQPPAKIIIDNEAAIAMATCNKDTAGNRHVARRYHYVRQGTSLKEHTFSWIGTKYQLADILTKPGTPKNFSHLWDLILFQDNDD